MTIWSRLCCVVGYGIHARADALWHLARGHRLRWRDNCAEPWAGMTGCITCYACPDSSDGETDVAFWTRYNPLLHWVGRTVCGWQGHRERKHPQRSVGWDDVKAEGIYEDVVGEWYCSRCLADL